MKVKEGIRLTGSHKEQTICISSFRKGILCTGIVLHLQCHIDDHGQVHKNTGELSTWISVLVG